MKKGFLIYTMLFSFLVEAQSDTARITKIAKLLTLSEFEIESNLENALNADLVIDTFTNEQGNGCFGLLNNRYILMKIITKHCEYIIAYDGVEGGKFYKLKGFSAYNPSDVREIIDNFNFINTPQKSFVNELDHLKYCTSAFRQFVYKKRIPRSCASLRDEEYRREVRSFRGSVPPR
jgi:hypothetical protein